MGIGDWGLGIGDWGLGPIPNPQSPIPNPQSPIPRKNLIINNIFDKKIYIIIIINKYSFSVFIYNNRLTKNH